MLSGALLVAKLTSKVMEIRSKRSAIANPTSPSQPISQNQNGQPDEPRGNLR